MTQFWWIRHAPVTGNNNCCYGNNDTHPTDEDSPTCPTEPYAKSKKESEGEIIKSVSASGKY